MRPINMLLFTFPEMGIFGGGTFGTGGGRLWLLRVLIMFIAWLVEIFFVFRKCDVFSDELQLALLVLLEAPLLFQHSQKMATATIIITKIIITANIAFGAVDNGAKSFPKKFF